MSDQDAARWRDAFSRCSSTLSALARTSDAEQQVSIRTWWVLCMGSHLAECKDSYSEWKSQAAASLPADLTAQHTREALSLPGFPALAKCVTLKSQAVGVEPGNLLDNVGGGFTLRKDWFHAVEEVEPLKTSLQAMLLAARREQLSWLAKLTRRPGAVDAALASSSTEMDVDEVRLCQVWMYGLASRLAPCKGSASAFAAGVGMEDPNQPLKNYQSKRWDPRSPVWQEMEACVHFQASRAGVTADSVWRRPRGSVSVDS